MIQVVERALLALKFLAEHREVRVADLARHLGVDKASAHRLLATLAEHGFVWQNAETRRYRLGPETLRLGRAFHKQNELVERLHPCLERLADRTGETVTLAVYDRGSALILDRVEGLDRVPTVSEVGLRAPIHAGGTCKVLLAHLPAEEFQFVVGRVGLAALTPRTITDAAALQLHLDEIRRQGYAISEGEVRPGFVGIGCPVFDYRGAVVASVGIAGPEERFPPRRRSVLIEEVRGTAREASRLLGARSELAAVF